MPEQSDTTTDEKREQPRNDGGTAFPVPGYDGPAAGGGSFTQTPQPGMTLRDWFAGQVLPAVYHPGGRYGPEGFAQVAEYAYAMADAMLAERDR